MIFGAYALSDKEIAHIKSLLLKQWTLSGIYARHYGKQDISMETFRKECKRCNIDIKALREAGMSSLRAKTFALIDAQESVSDEFNAGMRYLAKYDTITDDSDDGGDNEHVTVDDAFVKMNDDLQRFNS